MIAYALTVFLSSFLLFQIQPLIGRYILPWFGGGPAVWTTCMLFFQMALLAGYAYAHGTTRITTKRQSLLHVVLLLVALLMLPINPAAELWKPAPGDAPIANILLLLLANIGVPYLLLSATAPLVQHWFARSFPGRSPYRLYALSNIGSLLALISYPFLVEPNLTLSRQVTMWGWGFAAFTVCCCWCAFRATRAPSGNDVTVATPAAPPSRKPSRGNVTMWLLLSACGSAMLLATTNELCQEVAVVPFLWVAPLALYLITFIICFNSERASDRLLWGMLLIGSLLPACRVLYLGVQANIQVQVLVFLALLFTSCMVCHSELVRSRPEPEHLTGYYLIISAGGALGGVLIALVAPALFKGFWEFPLALALTCLVILIAWHRGGAFSEAPTWLKISLVTGQLALTIFAVSFILTYHSRAQFSSRNFYGVLRVIKETTQHGERQSLMHGRVVHGTQFLDPDRNRLPTTYYGPDSAAGLALQFHPRRLEGAAGEQNLKVGVVGLGAGTLAAYGQEGDHFRFYEINPEVIKISSSHFSFRKDSDARVDVVAGDARIVMEHELKNRTPQQFDVLVVDAFSSDAIPIHLLTRECFAIYWQHLNRDGILLLHITNRFLDLVPVLRAQARESGCRMALINSSADEQNGVGNARWVALTRNDRFLDSAPLAGRSDTSHPPGAKELAWTDDFAGLWQILKR
jgi:hypothetical protein